MEIIGNIVLYIIMACAIIGAIASIYNEKSDLGKEFLEGIHSIGPIFIPTAGIMASIPLLSNIVKFIFGPLYSSIGADPAMSATTFIAVDMGGYQLAYELAATKEAWIIAMITGYMAGATIVFSIPVGLAMLNKKDHKYMALGIMSGILTIPIGVFIASIIILMTKPMIRESISSNMTSQLQLVFGFNGILMNLIPLIIICLVIFVGLWFKPDNMIKGFMKFGKFMNAILRIVLVLSIVEYFTGIFAKIFGYWIFEPIFADSQNQYRALETAGAIGIMLSGAFPMVYLIKKYLAKPLEKISNKVGISSQLCAAMLAGAANILALFRLVEEMKPEDKVKGIAFSVCSAFLLGDHLAFTANFQPNLILPIMIGKLVAGLLAILIAHKLLIHKNISENDIR